MPIWDTTAGTSQGLGHARVVSFSHCGRSLAILHHGRDVPELVPLPFESFGSGSLYHGPKRLLEEDGEEPSQKRPRWSSETVKTHKAVGLALRNLPGVVSDTLVLRQDATTGTRAAVLQNNMTGQLAILDSGEEYRNTIKVATLPRSIPLQHVSSTVSMPSRLDPDAADRLKLIVNAKPAPVYYSDEPAAATHLPLVFRKDVRALRVDHHPHRLHNVGYSDSEGQAQEDEEVHSTTSQDQAPTL